MSLRLRGRPLFRASSAGPTRRWHHVIPVKTLKDTYINHIQFVGQRLLIGTSKDVYCYSVATQKIAKKISGSSVVSSYHDVEGHHIWLGTFHEGVKVLTSSLKKYVFYN